MEAKMFNRIQNSIDFLSNIILSAVAGGLRAVQIPF